MPKTWRRYFDFSGGLNTNSASHLIEDNEVQDVYNFKFDPSGVVETRDGMELSNTLTVTGLTHTVIQDAESESPPGATPPAGDWTVTTTNANDLRTAAQRMSTDDGDEQEGTYCLDVITDMRNAIVSDFEETGGIESEWTLTGDGTGAHSTTHYQGSKSFVVVCAYADWASYPPNYAFSSSAGRTFTTAKNYSNLADSDELHIALTTAYTTVPQYIDSAYVIVYLKTDDSNYYWRQIDIPPSSSISWTEYTIRKDQFNSAGSPDWSNITEVAVDPYLVAIDDWRPTVSVYMDIMYWSPYTELVNSILTFDAAQNYQAYAYTPATRRPMRAYLHAGEWDTGVSHAGMSLTSLTFQIRMREAGGVYHYTPTYTPTIDGGWTTNWVYYDDWTEYGGASSTWATTIASIVIRNYITITISDASLLDGTSIAEYVVVSKLDEFTWYGSSSSSVIRGIYKFYDSDGTNVYQYAAVGGKLKEWDNTDLTRAAGGDYVATAWWDFATLNDVCIAVNGADEPQKLIDSTTAATDITCASTTPAYVCTFENRIFAAGDPTYPSTLYWSALADPETWDTTIDTLDVYTADGQRITGLCPWKGNLVIFKDDSIFVLVAKGMPEYWELYKVDNHGCLAPRSIVATDAGILFLSQDGVRVYTEGPSNIVSDKIWPTIRDNIKWTATDEICAAEYDNLYRLWFVPTGGTYATYAAVLNIMTGVWSMWKTTGAQITCLFRDKLESNELYAGTANLQIIQCDEGGDDVGAAIAATLTTKDHNMGVPERDKKYKRVYVVAGTYTTPYYLTVDYNLDFATAGTGLTADHPDDVYLYSTSDEIVEHRESIGGRGKYINLVFTHTGTDEPVKIYGYTWGFRPKKLR